MRNYLLDPLNNNLKKIYTSLMKDQNANEGF